MVSRLPILLLPFQVFARGEWGADVGVELLPPQAGHGSGHLAYENREYPCIAPHGEQHGPASGLHRVALLTAGGVGGGGGRPPPLFQGLGGAGGGGSPP